MASSNSASLIISSNRESSVQDLAKALQATNAIPFISLDKPSSLDLKLHVSPACCTATVFLMVFDDSLLKPHPLTRRQKSNYSLDPTFLDTDSIFEDGCSLTMYSTDDERDEEDDLVGLSFVEGEEEKTSKLGDK